MTVLDASANFFNRRIGWKERHDALWNETLAHAGPFFEQPIVVSLHAGKLQLGIFDMAETLPTYSRDRWIEHGIIDSRRVHHFQTLFRIVRHRWHVGPPLRVLGPLRHSRTAIRHAVQGYFTPIDDPAVNSARIAINVRNTVTPL